MDSLKLIQKLLYERTGLAFPEKKDADLERHIVAAMDAAGIASMHSFYMQLWGTTLDYGLWRDLITRLTVGETYFFRNAGHFRALREHVLPEIIARKRAAHTPILRIWSAGCSTGEEPYSLAILLRELLPDLSQWTVSILATDINHDFLARARAGVYSERSFRTETPDYVRDRYFTPQEKTFHLLPSIRQGVRFKYLNLMDAEYPSAATYTLNLDLIVCRNVTIYFSPEVTRQVVGRFYESLSTGGYLLVGHSEPQLGLYDQAGFAAENLSQITVYRKTVAKQEPAPVAEVAPPPPPEPQPKRAPAKKPTPQPAELTPKQCCAKARELGNTAEVEEALRLLDCAIRKDAFYIEAYYIKALLYQQQENYTAALNALKQALYIDRTFVLGHFYVGMLNWQLNRRAEATHAWRIVRKLLYNVPADAVLSYGDGIQAGRLLHIVNTYMARIGTAQLNVTGG